MNDLKDTYEHGAQPAGIPDSGEAQAAPRYSNVYNPGVQPPNGYQGLGRYPEPDAARRPYAGGQYPQQGYPAYPQREEPYRQPAPGYGGAAQQQGYAQYGPGPSYQYRPGTGYQQPKPPQPELPAYEWRLSDYDAFSPTDGKKPAGKRKGHGLVIFAVCLLLTLSAGLVGIITLSLLNPQDSIAVLAPGSGDTPAEAYEAAPPPEAEASAGEGGGEGSIPLSLADKPRGEETAPAGGRLTIPQIAEKVTPSVVSVILYVNGQFLEPASIGSGIILSEDGYIVTNAHVVEGGTDFKVQLANGDPFDAEVIGMDAATDLAVIKINAQGLIPAELGDSDDLVVGETVIAVGNPADLLLSGSVTRGIVSALDRKMTTERYSINYIQTDAAVNPGNSGGALANEYGQVIGINVAKIIEPGYEGLAFAIPISDARPVIADLLQYGHVTGRAKVGIDADVVDEEEARYYGWQAGVMIQSIHPDSDLIGKDVQKGDIITHVNGERVYEVADIHAAMEGLSVGDTAVLSIYRKINAARSAEFDITVTLVEDAG
jgi:serine protease Do